MAAINGLFCGYSIMATDVDVQYFSHLNGLTLSNNWGDLIRLLDTCLVNGLSLTSITSATVDAQGDINLTLYAAHNCMLFQIVELSGFAPSGFNGKYRIKGTPSATTLILKAEKTGQTITTTGTAKLASLGYEIKFRDINDVKRVYRAIDPTDAHPFIRVDESQSGEGGGTYTSTYAKSAMVGLIENMTSIDDYADTSKLQLPLDTSDFTKNWKIVDTGANAVRGWSRWYWARGVGIGGGSDSQAVATGSRQFTLCGDENCFYLLTGLSGAVDTNKFLYGCGLISTALASDVIPNWVLMTSLTNHNASIAHNLGLNTPLANAINESRFYMPKYNLTQRISGNVFNYGVMPDFRSGASNIYSASNVAAMEIPTYDADKYLRGSLRHIFYSGNNKTTLTATTPLVADNSMYIWDCAYTGSLGGFYFYLGDME